MYRKLSGVKGLTWKVGSTHTRTLRVGATHTRTQSIVFYTHIRTINYSYKCNYQQLYCFYDLIFFFNWRLLAFIWIFWSIVLYFPLYSTYLVSFHFCYKFISLVLYYKCLFALLSSLVSVSLMLRNIFISSVISLFVTISALTWKVF